MTINTDSNKAVFLGDGVTTVFTFTFAASPLPSTDYRLTYTAADGTQTVLAPAVFTLAFTAPVGAALWGLGGSLTYPLSGSALPIGVSLTLERLLPEQQTLVLSNQGSLLPRVMEQGLDQLLMIIQQLSDQLGRSFQVPASDPDPAAVPAVAARKNLPAAFNANGDLIGAAGSIPVSIVSAFVGTLLGLTTAAAFFKAIGGTVSRALFGLGTTNNSGNNVTVAAGQVIDSAGTYPLILAAAITKGLNANWAVGTGNGGLDTGAEASSTVYYIWLIARSDTGVVDVLLSASATAPTMPASYDKKALIGAMVNNAASNLRACVQMGDTYFFLDAIAADITDGTITDDVFETGAVLAPALSVVTGIINVIDPTGSANIPQQGYIRPTGGAMTAGGAHMTADVDTNGATPRGAAGQFTVVLNASRQLDYAANSQGTQAPVVTVYVLGYRMPQLAVGA